MADRPSSLAAWVPRWWAGEAGVVGAAASAALLPAELLYRGAMRARNAAYDRGLLSADRAPIPVVSVGNIGVGGAGKTPFAAWLAREAAALGARPAVVMRGYAEDEVALHRELNPTMPVFVARRRIEAVREAAAAGCDAAVLDDGFQHRALARDLDVVLVSADAWERHARLLPRGAWREPPAALRRAALLVVTAKAARPERIAEVLAALQSTAPELAAVVCRLRPASIRPLGGGAELPLEALRGTPVVAAAALADPRAFERNLRALGAVTRLAAYRDHHVYTAADAAALLRLADGRPIVTTHKDAVKLRALLPADTAAWVLHQHLELDAAARSTVVAMLAAALERGDAA